jgi:tellurite resistance protein TehA-like permease
MVLSKMGQHFPGIFMDNVKNEIANLSPSYFALTMATGIISIAAHIYKFSYVAVGLFYFNIVAYCILWLLFFLRLIFYFPKFYRDINDDAQSPGFLTMVAGTCILGEQFLRIRGNYTVAIWLYFFGFVLWLVLLYSLFVIIISTSRKVSLGQGMSAFWLIIIVATESVSVLGTALAPHLPFRTDAALFISLVLYLIGCMLYIVIITLIFYRLTFFDLRAQELTPAYWINMGAVAIVTLAGSYLIQHVAEWNFLHSIIHFLNGFTLLFWSFGTWWIPLIIILGVWRHINQSIPIRYHPQYWGLVFPLGMYTVCTYNLVKATGIQFLSGIPSVFIYISFFAWAATMIGLIHKVTKNFYIPAGEQVK